MGNILNIIDSRNDFKKMDGLLPLQCGPFFNFEFDNYSKTRTRDWKDRFRYKRRDEQLHILQELRNQNGESYRGVPRLNDGYLMNWPKSDDKIENDPEFLKWRFENNTGTPRNRSTAEFAEMYKEKQNE